MFAMAVSLLVLFPASAGTLVSEDEPVDRSDGSVNPIINGDDAEIEDFPMTGAILFEADYDPGTSHPDYTRSFVCSSTLIAPDVVLAAAHCIDTEMYLASSGHIELVDPAFRFTREPDLRNFDPSDEWPDDAVEAAEWVVHEDWDYEELELGLSENNDIGLLFLEEPVDAPYAYLPLPDEVSQIVEGALVKVVGWGMQESGTSGEKQFGGSTIAALNEFEMQIGGEEEDTRKCYGDSGGPTFLSVQSTALYDTRLIGVTSHIFDSSACDEVGVVDTRVDYFLEWIDEELREGCETGARAWCDQPGIPAVPHPAELESEPEQPRLLGCATAGRVPGVAILGALAMLLRRSGTRRVGSAR